LRFKQFSRFSRLFGRYVLLKACRLLFLVRRWWTGAAPSSCPGGAFRGPRMGEPKMAKRLVLLGLVFVFLAGISGCGWFHGWLYSPFGPGTLVDTRNCGPECGSVCAGPCDPCGCPVPCAAPCEPACGEPCGPPCAEPCGVPCGPGCGPYYPGPLACILGLFHAPTWYGPACGERYWGDFHGDPPDCCDPCNRHGEYVGPGAVGCDDCNKGVPAAATSGVISRKIRSESTSWAPRPHRARR